MELLVKAGEINLSTVFIDGTKIEAQANRYTFVWKKAVEKRLSKLLEKMSEPVFITGGCRMGEEFFRQTRRFFAGGLTPGKENRRSMAEKDPLRRRPTVVNTGSKLALDMVSDSDCQHWFAASNYCL